MLRALVTLATLSAMTAASVAAPPGKSKLSPTAVKACLATGGSVIKVGMAQAEACVRLFADRGKKCTGPSDCEGECRYWDDTRPILPVKGSGRSRLSQPLHMPATGTKAVGQCQWTSDPFGCRATVAGGRVQSSFCVD
jgi:hypothetical protein